jgi:cyclic-di-AMP phosphodiesterase PgpH
MMKETIHKITQRFKLPFSQDMGANGKSSSENWYNKFRIDIGIGVLLAIILTLLYPQGKSFQFTDLKEGKVYVGPEIIAPFTFPVNKSDQEYNQDILDARQNVAPVFQRDENLANSSIQNLDDFLENLLALLKSREAVRSDIETLLRDVGVNLSEESVQQLWAGFSSPENQQDVIALRSSHIAKIKSQVTKTVGELFSAGILDLEKANLDVPNGKISVRDKGQEILEDLNFYWDIQEIQESLLEKFRETQGFDESKVKIAYQIAEHFVVPNILFNKSETDLRIEVAVSNVALAKDQVLAGERIINSHERITKEHIDKLNSLATEKAERGESGGFWDKAAPTIGKFFLNIFVITILVIFIYRYKPDTLYFRKNIILIGLTILFIAFTTFLLNRFEFSIYLAPVAIGAIIITIFFDVVTSFLVSIVLSLIIGAMRGGEFGITFVSVFVCAVAILSVSKVRNRNWVMRSFFMIATAYFLAITVQNLVSYVPFNDMLQDWGFGIFTGFFSPIFAYGLIIILEYGFDMTTDMTLLELSDLNQPLLRQLAIQAPGTYHHSLMVGNLAESAAEAIGGNALLARVGAYYHDIGKMEKPEYFVENQTKGRNPQEKLTPTMSSLILANHVRKGVEIAQQHNLPKEIEAFIYEHHGTGLMNFFYKKALEQNTDAQVSENEFRYPGPRPQNKETAIVMLADAVEAVSRTLKDPPPSRITAFVEQIIDERFKSGELDNSPLTLQDLSKISAAFQKVFNGIFHGRIEYPSAELTNNKTDKKRKTD